MWKQKIYVLYHNDYEGSLFLGAFSSDEKAEAFRQKFYNNMKDYSIDEDVINPETNIRP